jgi:hypothetical protein
MNSVNKTSRILGAAFLLQAVTSLISGLIMKKNAVDINLITLAKNIFRLILII